MLINVRANRPPLADCQLEQARWRPPKNTPFFNNILDFNLLKSWTWKIVNHLVRCKTIIGQTKVLPGKKKTMNLSFQFVLLPPLEKVVNLAELLAVSVRCNLGWDSPEDGIARTNPPVHCVYVQMWVHYIMYMCRCLRKLSGGNTQKSYGQYIYDKVSFEFKKSVPPAKKLIPRPILTVNSPKSPGMD